MKKKRALTKGVWLLAFIAVSLQSPAYIFYAQNPNSSLNQAISVNTSLDLHTEWRVEPVVRVGLITDSESVAVSAEGSGLVAEVGSDVCQPLDTSFVKVQTRPAQIIETSPVPTPARQATYSYIIRVTELRNRSEADVAARDVNSLTGRETRIFQLPENPKQFVVELDAGSSDSEAMHLKMLLEEQGFLVEIVRAAGTSRLVPAAQTIGYSVPTVPVVRSTARTTSMRSETLVFGSKSLPLLSAREPVVFAPLKPGTPLTVNSRTYRGKIEIFSNPKGRLTVVNVVRLEDYVKGVISNELSPIVFPELEALKAQAVAARTYAVKHRDQFAPQGFDLLPTTQSQVYGGLSSERPLGNKAVDETRGIIAEYDGQPIDALYTSTCGGRTEDAEDVFGGKAFPYLRSRECATEEKIENTAFQLVTSRDLPEVSDERNAELVRDTSLLAVNGFEMPKRLRDEWLMQPATSDEIRKWISVAARINQQTMPVMDAGVNRVPGFAVALVKAVYGENRGDTLLNGADVDYLLPFRDAAEIASSARSEVAFLVKENVLLPFPDATLRVREPLSRARALKAVFRLLERRNMLQIQSGTTRPASNGKLIIRSKASRDLSFDVARDAFLLESRGDVSFPVTRLDIVGGESVSYHLNTERKVDYITAKPSSSGAAADRFSNYSNWTAMLSLEEIRSRLLKASKNVGTIQNLIVVERGRSRRVVDLEFQGSQGAVHIRNGRIRSTLGLKDQLFVIDRLYDDSGALTGFAFTGRGFGHGVGLCQVGAYGLARAGYNFDQILNSYYTGIELAKLY